MSWADICRQKQPNNKSSNSILAINKHKTTANIAYETVNKSRNYCKLYGSALGCKYSNKCKFYHSNPNSVPLWKHGKSCLFGDKCRYRHQHYASAAYTNSKWIQLQQYPINITSLKIIKINDNEFAVISPSNSKDIYKYNTNCNKWIKWLTYPNPSKLNIPHISAVCFDKNNGLLYVFDADGLGDAKGSLLTNINVFTNEYEQYDIGCLSWCASSLAIIDHKDNMFVNAYGIIRDVWNDKKKVFEDVNCETASPSKTGKYRHSNICNLLHPGQLFLLSNNTLISIGNNHTICRFDIDENEWSLIENCEYPIGDDANQIWSDYAGGCVLTSDEKYIITFGGCVQKYSDGHRTRTTYYIDLIFILDLHNMVFYSSQIKCPTFGQFQAIITNECANNNLLICGYMRVAMKCMPTDVVHLIEMWYGREYVHIINDNTLKHWKISVDAIIDSLEQIDWEMIKALPTPQMLKHTDE